jgi:hypothetical protein
MIDKLIQDNKVKSYLKAHLILKKFTFIFMVFQIYLLKVILSMYNYRVLGFFNYSHHTHI